MKKNLRKRRRLKRSDKMIDQDIVPQSFQKLVKDFEDTEEFKNRMLIQIFKYC